MSGAMPELPDELPEGALVVAATAELEALLIIELASLDALLNCELAELLRLEIAEVLLPAEAVAEES